MISKVFFWIFHFVIFFSRTCRYFSGLCTSNIPRYFLDFASMLLAHTFDFSAPNIYLRKNLRGPFNNFFLCDLSHMYINVPKIYFTWVQLIALFLLLTKFNSYMTTYLHRARAYITIQWYTAVLKWAKSSKGSLVISGVYWARHNLDVASNSSFKEVKLVKISCLKIFFTYVLIDLISISDNKSYWRKMSAVIKTSIL